MYNVIRFYLFISSSSQTHIKYSINNHYVVEHQYVLANSKVQ